MALPTDLNPHFLASSAAFKIERSLRFNSADSAYLNRTPASASNRKTWTWSGWVKRSALSSTQHIFGAYSGTGSDTTLFSILFNSSDQLSIDAFTQNWRVTSQVFRDVGAWYHIVVAFDTTQATAGDRIKLYVNGTQVTAFGTSNNPTQNTDYVVNNTVAHYIGINAYTGNTSYFNGYVTEINFIDGQALTPSDFGETDSATGVWKPKKYTGTYGTNGFYLKFADNSGTTSTTLGKDSSGNGNNWTPNNFSVTAGAGNDSLVDTPTPYGTDTGAGGEVRGNYATWNPIHVIPSNTTNTFVNGNLQFAPTQAEGTGESSAVATMPLPTTGKWYWEVTPTAVATTATRTQIGIMAQSTISYAMGLIGSGNFAYTAYGGVFSKVNNNSYGSYGDSYAANDVIGVAVDLDNGAIYFAKNGTWQNSGVPTSGSSKTGAAYTTLTGSSNYFPAVGYWGTFVANFGQRPFAYTAPSGFKALVTQNLPTPTIGATATTRADDYFNTVLWTGNGTSQSITGVGFQPDFVWYKARSAAYAQLVVDAVRGSTKYLYTYAVNAEETFTNQLTSFDSNGFSVGNGVAINASGESLVAWNWKANGAGSSDTSGTITSTVSKNTTAGFSIVTYTGNGSSSATVGHGLTSPAMVIVKRRSTATLGNTDNWTVKHTSLAGTQQIRLNQDGAAYNAGASAYGGISISASTFGFLTGTTSVDAVNENNATYVAYCFSEVAGYSKFESYTGNGSTDGPFVFTGFRPAWVLVKPSSTTGDWLLYDNKRNAYNVVNNILYPNASSAEATSGGGATLDFVSNGFKLRGAGAGFNDSGATFIYAAFAENPFKYSLAR